MSLDDVLKSLGLGAKDMRTNEQKLQDLKDEAEEAERLAGQAKQAGEYRKRIAAARVEHRKALTEGGAAVPKKSGMSRTQLIVFVVAIVIVFFLLVKSC